MLKGNGTMTILEFKKQYLSQYAMSSDCTKQRYKNEVELFFEIFGIKNVQDIENLTETDIEKFYNYSKAKEWRDKTTNQRLQTIKNLLGWATRKHFISENVFADVKPIRTVNKVHYTPCEDDCEKLLQFIKEHTNKKRLYLMTKLLMATGFRRNEICSLKVDDIDKEQCTIRVLGKGKKLINQPVPSQIIIELIEYINTERKETMDEYKVLGGKDKGFLFVSNIGEKSTSETKDLTNGNQVNHTSFYQQIKRFASKAGIPNADKITLHSIRRSAGTTIYNNTGDIKTASEFLRHSSVNTTEQCYVNYDENRLSSAVNKMFEKQNNLQENSFSQEDEYQLFLLLKKKFGNAV